MKKQMLLTLLTCTMHLLCFAQDANNELYSRLCAIHNNRTDFYNIDGIEITRHHIYEKFSTKAIVKAYKKFTIKTNDLVNREPTIQEENFYVHKVHEVNPQVTQYTSYYFIKNSYDEITAFTFVSINKTNHEFELKMIGLIYRNQIPQHIFAAQEVDTIDFAGRKIDLGCSCHWMRVNNIRCNNMGQMNWSIHKTAEDAAETVNNQFNVMLSGNKGKIKKDETVDVIFEGTEVKARRIIFDPKGLITNLLISMSGGKELTVYYLSAPIRGNYVSCVLSHWDNDYITDGGLPPLTGEVMALKK